VYNIKKAVSRLDFAPKIDDIKVTDIKQGLGIFTPKSGKPVSFAALKATLKKAGYTLASAEITVDGTLGGDASGYWIEADSGKQRFYLADENAVQTLKGLDAGSHLEISGEWETTGQGAETREVIHPRAAKKLPASKTAYTKKHREENDAHEVVYASLSGGVPGPTFFPAPVRTTSPGLTVYRGGAVTPRYFSVRQHLGGLQVTRHAARLALSYTPTTTLQLEAEIPYLRTSFDDGAQSGSGSGLGNITVWGKHRFYRSLEAWGDRQAALRFGVELPTGSTSVPSADSLAVPELVRQQLSAINGGVAFHTDVSYSQAHHRFIYGANIEGTVRGERDGFRMGHELRVNTDLEYVLLPLKYQNPGKELFVILETTYSYRNRARIDGRETPGSSSSEFYLAPALQFTASPRLVLEASYQFPVVLNSGPLVLRTDSNFLLGIKYLY
jgi:outer membrane putative beta-barrel porin/alpha-amylase